MRPIGTQGALSKLSRVERSTSHLNTEPRLLQGAVRWEYERGGNYFYMGRPVTDEYSVNASTRAQRFEDGIIYWSNGRIWTDRY